MSKIKKACLFLVYALISLSLIFGLFSFFFFFFPSQVREFLQEIVNSQLIL